jgi:hypothetical protein
MANSLTLKALDFLLLSKEKGSFSEWFFNQDNLNEHIQSFSSLELPSLDEIKGYIDFFETSDFQIDLTKDEISEIVWSHYFFASLHCNTHHIQIFNFSQTALLLIHCCYKNNYFKQYKPEALLKVVQTLLSDLSIREIERKYCSTLQDMILAKLVFHIDALNNTQARMEYKILRKLQNLAKASSLSPKKEASFLRHVANLNALFQDEAIRKHSERLNSLGSWENYKSLTGEEKAVVRLRELSEILSLKWDRGKDFDDLVSTDGEDFSFAHGEAVRIENTYTLLKAKEMGLSLSIGDIVKGQKNSMAFI